ncbi:MAG: PspC domain-containing protein, partial [Ignavibacteriaceae bacterium]
MADEKKTEVKIAKKTDAETEPGKRIYRSQSDKVIGGVCGGLAEYINIDALIVRIIWAVAFFVGGVGFVAYIACWIIIPENPSGAKDAEKYKGKSNNSTLLWGFVLIF